MISRLGCLLWCFAVFVLNAVSVAGHPSTPQRIVSLDYCADQFVLKFADRDSITALSPDAEQPYSYMRQAAVGLPKIEPRAENILALQPDLVVRSHGGSAQLMQFLEQAGIDVMQVQWVNTIDDVVPNLLHLSESIGVPERGVSVAEEFELAISSAYPSKERTALYLTSGGVTTGPGSLVHELIVRAGYMNFETRPGWHALPLERLAGEKPDLVIAGFFDHDPATPGFQWSAMRHPVAQSLLSDLPVLSLSSAWTICGGWYLDEAITALAAGADK